MVRRAKMWTAAGAFIAASAFGALVAPVSAHAAAEQEAVVEATSEPPTEANGTSGEALGLGAVVVFFAVATIRRLRRAA
jgi:hypothetical protein